MKRAVVTGASGLIGSVLTAELERDGWEVVRLVRRTPGPGEAAWDPPAGRIDGSAFEGADAVIHLAGERVAGRWTKAKKERILASRVEGTQLVARAAAQAAHRPAVLVTASAVGWYGDRGDEELDESSGPGEGFLAEVARRWEEAAEAAAEAGVRVVRARFGVVLSARGGALAQMLTPFRYGFGGRIGHGRQYWSWVALDDAVEAVRHVMDRPEIRGPVNVTAPHPVTNRQFTRALARALRRPAVLPMPAALARLAFGEMADALLLASARVLPRKLLASGYAFRHPELDEALRSVLAAPGPNA